MRRVVIVLAFGAFACGSPSSPPPRVPAAPEEVPDVVPPKPHAARPPAPPPPWSVTPPAAPVLAAAPEAVAPAEKPDECAPVSAAYEASLRPKLKKCWADGAKARPKERIVGTVRYLIEVDGLGKLATQKQLGESSLPAPIQACMLKAVKAEKLDGARCAFKSLTIEEKFPR